VRDWAYACVFHENSVLISIYIYILHCTTLHPVVSTMREISEPLACSARLFDDGIIDPRDTRQVLCACLDICRQGRQASVKKNTYGIARL
jgi:hypothetical protein